MKIYDSICIAVEAEAPESHRSELRAAMENADTAIKEFARKYFAERQWAWPNPELEKIKIVCD